MKKSITLSALILLFTASVFAAVPPVNDHTVSSRDAISVAPLKAQLGIGVSIHKLEAGKSFVSVYNSHNDVVFRDMMSSKQFAQKGYILSDLDNGDYTIKVTTDNQEVTKKVHIYDEYGKKTYFFID